MGKFTPMTAGPSSPSPVYRKKKTREKDFVRGNVGCQVIAFFFSFSFGLCLYIVAYHRDGLPTDQD